MTDSESVLRYYTSELSYLRRMGGAFAQRYPGIAGRLELSEDQCTDPQVERLIESFAFLTARLQKRLDGEFPEISTALLELLYPHLANPAPSLAVARFDVDPERGRLSGGHEVRPGTRLFTQSDSGTVCRFRTCYPVTIWPVSVAEASLESPARYDFLDRMPNVASVLRLRIAGLGIPLEALSLGRLRFYLNGESTLVNQLFELLFCHAVGVGIAPAEGTGRTAMLAPNSIRPVGFEPDEAVLPYPSHALPAYRLLQEYFLFPRKFHFFDLDHLDKGMQDGAMRGSSVDILILLDRALEGRLTVEKRNFCLGCTPIVNLFNRTSEPIRLDHRRHEYRLEPDIHRPRTTEIHSIGKMSASANPLEESVAVHPFYSFRHQLDGKEPRAFWYARRTATAYENLSGTDLHVSFVDLDFNPQLPDIRVVYAHTLCTNRDFAAQMPSGQTMQIEEVAPVLSISCLGKPTLPVYPPLDGRTLWYLISSLSLNYLSLSGERGSVEALREILRLYSFSELPSIQQQVQGIREMKCRRVTRRLGREPWRGFCQGTEVDLLFDEGYYVGSTPFLLGSVLNRFLPLYSSINSFTELKIRSVQREGVWKQWPPRAGYQELI